MARRQPRLHIMNGALAEQFRAKSILEGPPLCHTR